MILENDIYGLAIALLLPVAAAILVAQDNPYYALVLRGILGSIAALVYALFGAADVALTEALVGTMLSITLYAIAVRSSLSMRLGILESDQVNHQESLDTLFQVLRPPLQQHHLRLEIVPYPSQESLSTALQQSEIHTIAFLAKLSETSSLPLYQLQTRVLRLYSLLTQVPEAVAISTYITLPDAAGEYGSPPTMTSIFEQTGAEQL